MSDELRDEESDVVEKQLRDLLQSEQKSGDKLQKD